MICQTPRHKGEILQDIGPCLAGGRPSQATVRPQPTKSITEYAASPTYVVRSADETVVSHKKFQQNRVAIKRLMRDAPKQLPVVPYSQIAPATRGQGTERNREPDRKIKNSKRTQYVIENKSSARKSEPKTDPFRPRIQPNRTQNGPNRTQSNRSSATSQIRARHTKN